MHTLMTILHIAAILFFFPALFVTIPLHLLLAKLG